MGHGRVILSRWCRLTRQQMLGQAAGHARTLGREEVDDQADLLLRTFGHIPGKIDAVGVAQIGLAVVFLEQVLGKDELPVRAGVAGGAAGLVEAVDDQRPVDLDRIAALFVVEVEPSAEAPLGRLVRLVLDRFLPHRHHPNRCYRLVIGAEQPRKRPLQFELATAGPE